MTVTRESESFAEQMARVQQMAEDAEGMTWDLSADDRAALAALLESHDEMRIALKAIVNWARWKGVAFPPTFAEQARAALAKAEGR